ncbi:hypothetical protein Areg01_75790 [Actinoplanes regularis]|nr:hypothetical protein Areg01_75790 [Actinoplanes regularis]
MSWAELFEAREGLRPSEFPADPIEAREGLRPSAAQADRVETREGPEPTVARKEAEPIEVRERRGSPTMARFPEVADAAGRARRGPPAVIRQGAAGAPRFAAVPPGCTPGSRMRRARARRVSSPAEEAERALSSLGARRSAWDVE